MKRIIICADGTWNEPDQIDEKTGKRRPTNVTKVARAVRPQDAQGSDQVVFYHDGVGTGGPLDRFSGGAFGKGIEENIRALYRFLVLNFVPGDEIFLFGFSRGAFTVRSLAGFMHRIGLLEKDDDYWVPDLYELYESASATGNQTELDQLLLRCKGVRPCPPIKFIGVWDTVGALGAPGIIGGYFNRGKYKHHDLGLTPSIQNAYHALAIDEKREPFKPTLWRKPDGWTGELAQAWFAGVHSNVGGSYTPDGLANEALHWIVEHAERHGLAVDSGYLGFFKACFNTTLHDSMSIGYRVALLGPADRDIELSAQDGLCVHQSAIDRMNWPDCSYSPSNLVAAMNKLSTASVFANTSRVQRGVAC
jgi:uncharacterized protein (DUF2235 family)